MKTELRVEKHTEVAGANIVELWHDGKMIGVIAGADGPGARIVTKHPVTVRQRAVDPNIVDVLINPAVIGGGPAIAEGA